MSRRLTLRLKMPNWRLGAPNAGDHTRDIQRQPNANVIATVNAIKRELPTLTSGLPAAMQVSVVSDGTTSIRASVSDAKSS